MTLEGNENKSFTCSKALASAMEAYAEAYGVSSSKLCRWALASFIGDENHHIQKQFHRDRHRHFEDQRDHFQEQMREAKRALDETRELERDAQHLYDVDQEEREQMIRDRVDTLARVVREKGIDKAKDALGTTKVMQYASQNEVWSRVLDRTQQ